MQALTLSADWAPKPGYDLSPLERKMRRPRNANMVWKSPRITLGDAPDPALATRPGHAGHRRGWHLRQ